MRSRYAAFVLDLRPYLLASWHASTRPVELAPPEPGLKWLGLDVKRMALPALRHRIMPSPELELEGRDTDAILKGLLDKIEAPRK